MMVWLPSREGEYEVTVVGGGRIEVRGSNGEEFAVLVGGEAMAKADDRPRC